MSPTERGNTLTRGPKTEFMNGLEAVASGGSGFSESLCSASLDLALLTRWRDGDTAAGMELLDRQRKDLPRLGARFGVGSPDVLIDVFQDAVLVTVQQLPELPEKIERSFAGWFAWQVRDAVGRWRRRNALVGSLTDSDLLRPGPRPDTNSAAELLEALRICASKLPPRELDVFDLRFVRGMEVLEVAETLGRQANAVSQAIFRLSRRLRACLSAAGFAAAEASS